MMPALAHALEEPRPLSDEEQRLACFEMFNTFWQEAADRGIPFDTIGTMSISSALFAIVARHGPETTAEFVQDLVNIVRSGEFNMPTKAH
ncbi:MAG: hypothetical protein JNN33_11760 [Rhodospirillaceae bacterium]|jgi:hypothetical protein|nr:hypothetical protein [Rhodospirillaceae bacterium]